MKGRFFNVKKSTSLKSKNTEIRSISSQDECTTSTELTIVANVAIATGPALFGAPRSFVLNLFFYYMQGWLLEF